MKRVSDDSSEIPHNSSYDSRSRFIKNTDKAQHGVSRRSNYTGYGDNRKPRSGLIFNPPLVVKFMQRKSNNAIAIQQLTEFKQVDENTVMMQVTNNRYNMIDGPSASRWNYSESDSMHSITNGESIAETKSLFIIKCDESMRVKASVDGLFLLLGNNEQSSESQVGNVTTFTDGSDNQIDCIELKGVNANLWESVDLEKIEHLLNPTIAAYMSPVFQRSMIDLGELDSSAGMIAVGRLRLYKLPGEPNLGVATGKLTATMDFSKIEITCSLCRGAVLTYVEGGNTVSRDVEEGNYVIRLDSMPGDLTEYRETVLIKGSEVSVDFEVNRLDYLTSIEIDKNGLQDTTSWELRLDPGASVSIDDGTISANMDKTLFRVDNSIDDE
jgi:hypothetical protein